MYIYTIQDENNEVYGDLIFTSMGHASEVADMLIQTWGKYYWVTPMRSIEYDSQVFAETLEIQRRAVPPHVSASLLRKK